MKKIFAAVLLLGSVGSIYAQEIPESFRGLWSLDDGSAYKVCSSTDGDEAIMTIDPKAISGSEYSFVLKNKGQTQEDGKVFSAEYKLTSDEPDEDVKVKLQLTDTGKLLKNGDELYRKCTDEERAERQREVKVNDLRQGIYGIWSSVADSTLYSIFYRGDDKVAVMMDSKGPYIFTIDNVDVSRDSITLTQNEGTSNVAWTLKSTGSGDDKSMALIDANGTRSRLSFVREATSADQRGLEAAFKADDEPEKKTRTAWASATANVRVAPNGTVKCVVDNAQRINILGAQAGDDGSVWYKTDYCGKTAYIHSSQLKF